MAPLAMPSIARMAAICAFMADRVAPVRDRYGIYFQAPFSSFTNTKPRSSAP